MKLKIEFYKQDEENVSEIEKEIIDKYIKKHSKDEYEQVIEQDDRLEVILALSQLRENIISWYPFKKQCKILEIDGNLGEITGKLCDYASKVTTIEQSKIKAEAIAQRHNDRENLEIIVGKIENIKFEEKFDYIVAINIKDKNILKIAQELLNEDGIILTAFNNRFGVKYLSTVRENGENLLNRKNNQNINIFEEYLQQLNLKRKIYFVLTDYKLANLIFSEQFLIAQENISRNIPYYQNNDIKVYNQNEIYDKILEEKDVNLLKNFANSFFIEIFKNNYIENGIKFVSFANMRKSEYRIKTIIQDDGVIKQSMSNNSNEHIETIKRNIQYMNDNDIKTIDTFDDEQIKSEFQEEQTLDNIIIEMMKNGQKEEAINLIMKFKETLMNKVRICENLENNAFDKYNIQYNKKDIEKMHFAESGLIDLIFQNCFYKNNEFYFYDQEWMEENIPIEFILYRSVVYCSGIKKFINEEELLNKLGISKEQADLFSKLDNGIQEKIRNNTIWKLSKNGINVKEIHSKVLTLQHQINLMALEKNNIREEIQKLEKEKQKLEEEKQKVEEENQHLKKELNDAQQRYDELKENKKWKLGSFFNKDN